MQHLKWQTQLLEVAQHEADLDSILWSQSFYFGEFKWDLFLHFHFNLIFKVNFVVSTSYQETLNLENKIFVLLIFFFWIFVCCFVNGKT